MAVEFIDNHVQVESELNDAVIAFLHEAAGELEAQTKRNSRPIKYGKHDVKNSWSYTVDESDKTATVGSPLQAAYWEELGTGEYALNKDGRKGWWVYVEGNDTPKSVQHQYTEAEARQVVAFLRAKGLEAYCTKGTPANRPLFNAFNSLKTRIQKRAEEVLKARFGE